MLWFNASADGAEKVGAQSLEADGGLRDAEERERFKPARGSGLGRGRGRRVGLAPVGRAVLWAFVGLVLLRGLGAIFGGGEGFDDPRLDTLVLALPVAWRGTVVQYAGRLHRGHDDKSEVRILDYVDHDVGVLRRMFAKRQRAYRAMGYEIR